MKVMKNDRKVIVFLDIDVVKMERVLIWLLIVFLTVVDWLIDWSLQCEMNIQRWIFFLYWKLNEPKTENPTFNKENVTIWEWCHSSRRKICSKSTRRYLYILNVRIIWIFRYDFQNFEEMIHERWMALNYKKKIYEPLWNDEKGYEIDCKIKIKK